jgi:hypothetical protein
MVSESHNQPGLCRAAPAFGLGSELSMQDAPAVEKSTSASAEGWTRASRASTAMSVEGEKSTPDGTLEVISPDKSERWGHTVE